MKSHQNWIKLVVFLLVAGLLLVACERPLPGGYNDPDAGLDTTVPDTLDTIPGIDTEAPVEGEVPLPAEPADAEAEPAEGEGEQSGGEGAVEEGAVDPGLTADDSTAGEVSSPEGDQGAPEDSEAPAADEVQSEVEAGPEEEQADDAAETPGTHTVVAGENLFRISMLYDINWLDLAEANGITDPASLSVGQVLTIPGVARADEDTAEAEAAEEAPAQPESEGSDSEEAAAEETAEDAPQSRPETYVVQAGDNLYRIGVTLGVDWNEIVAANDIVGNQITPGQVLIIPPLEDSDTDAEGEVDDSDEAVEEPAESTAEETTYVVQEGDSVYSVAFLNGIPWTTLVETNNLEAPYILEAGQTLIIPRTPAGE